MRTPIAAYKLFLALLGILCLGGLSAQVVLPDNIVPADCTTDVEAIDWGIVQGASSQPLSHMYAQPYIGDIDNDGLSEIVTVGYYNSPSQASSIVIYGSNLQLKYSFNTPQMYVYGGYPVAIADVDRDGLSEIFVHNTDGHLRAYHHNGTLIWTSNTTSTTERAPSLIIADVNGDSIPEIWSLDKIYNAVSGELLVSLPEIIGCSSLYLGNPGQASMPVFADFDNDGVLELAGGNKVYKLTITNTNGTSGNSASLWKNITSNGIADGLTSVADIDLDGFLDIVVVQNNRMYVWKPYSGPGSNSEMIASCPYSSNTAGSRALLTDVDNDDYPEILFTYATKITAYKYIPATQTLQQMWLKNTSDLSGATTMTAFDFNQDGSVEIVYRDESDMRIIDGITGNNKSSFVCKAPTATDYPAIVDLDKDGQAEIIASSSTYDNDHDMHAKLVVFKSPANVRWAPARHVWSQHAYNVINVNNDLTIPAYNFNPATTFTDPQGVVRRPFNNFLQQATTLDEYGRPFMPLANVSATTDTSVMHANGTYIFTFRFCNTGSQILTAPYPIACYANSYMGPLLTTETITSSLSPDSCLTWTLHLTDETLQGFGNLQQIVVSLNDHGTGIAQNGGQQTECDTTDNIFIFPASPCLIPRDTVAADVCIHEPYSDANFDIAATETALAGEHYFTRTYTVGECDSVIVLHLRVHPAYNLQLSETMPEDMDYDRHGIHIGTESLTGLGQLDTTLFMQSIYGCDSVLHISIHLSSPMFALYLPNAITPNGDGLNDEFFIPEKLQSQMSKFEILIYNRWGEVVFFSQDKGFRWDGSYRGKIYKNTVYQYMIRCKDLMGCQLQYKGSLTVL